MFLFSRVLTLSGPPQETMSWAVEINNKVNSIVDINVACWAALYGRPIGTFAWSTIVESRAQVVDIGTTLLADSDYLSLVSSATGWVQTPGQDYLRQLINPGPPPAAPPGIGAVAQMTTAVVNAGKYAEAFAWGLDMAEYTSGLTGSPVGFFSDVVGTFGGVAWVSIVADMAALDALDANQNDPGYLSRIGNLGDLFVPGSGNVSLLTRIA